MFTHVVDDAINRVEFDGCEVAAVYDDCASNPLEDFGIKGFAITRNKRGYTAFDPEELFDCYDGALDDKGMALDCIKLSVQSLRDEYGTRWWEGMTGDEKEVNWILEEFDAVDEANDSLKGMVSYTFNATKHYGWPEFRVIVDTDTFQKAWGPTNSKWEDVYQRVADTYADYAEGDVYVIGFTDSDGYTDYRYDVMGVDVDDDEELKAFALENF